MLTLRWFRERGSPVSVVTLVTYLSGLLATGTAWAAPARAEGLDRDELSGALGSPDFEAGPRALKDRAASLGDPAGATDSPAESSESPSAPEAATPPSPDTVQSEAVPTVPEDSAELVSAQAISLPSGAATMAGMGESFTAQLTTGVAAYSVPFALPGGRAGFSPALSLIYSSSAGYGLAGVGWSLSGSLVVARQSDRGLPGYDDRDDWHPEQDRFSFGGQELVPI